jgi:hypothetical protein
MQRFILPLIFAMAINTHEKPVASQYSQTVYGLKNGNLFHLFWWYTL